VFQIGKYCAARIGGDGGDLIANRTETESMQGERCRLISARGHDNPPANGTTAPIS